MYRLSNITYFISNRCLFDKVSLTFNKGDRIGLIGPNGAGKTTLLRIMSGKLIPDKGLCEWPNDTRVGYLQQESLEVARDQTVRDLVMEAFAEANRLEEEIEEISENLAGLDSYEGDEYIQMLNRLELLQSRYEIAGSNKREGKVEEALTGLGFASADLDSPLHTFSGGWQMRALLAKLLLEAPDILLLDEPTNHLDIDSIEWLERYLPGYPGAVLLVSHDQMFLNRMVTHIAALQHRRIAMFTGNYDDYERQYSQQLELQRQAYENQQKELEQTEKFISRFRYKSSKARQVQSKIKMLDKMERVEMPEEDNTSIDFRFPEPPRSGIVAMSIHNLKKSYRSGREQPVHVFTESQDIELERGDKVALIGVNGAGKSTLARIINGNEPFDGDRVPGHNVIMTFFAQHLADVMGSDRTVLEEMEQSAKTSEARTRIRGILGAFLFSGDDVFKKVGVLSGGERSRLALAKSLLEPANLLILDEPTNHLDIRSKKVLLRALDQYQGTVVAVSHDRFFLNGFANKIWRVENGRVYEYPGDFTYYEWKSKQQKLEGNLEKGGVTPSSNGQKQASVNGKKTANDKKSGDGRGLAKGRNSGMGIETTGKSNVSTGKSNDSAETGNESGNNNRSGNGRNSKLVPGIADESGPKSKEKKRAEAKLRNSFSREMTPLRKKLADLEKQIEKLEEAKADIESRLADPVFYESGEAKEVLKQHADLQRRLAREMDNWTEASAELEVLESRFQSALEESMNGI